MRLLRLAACAAAPVLVLGAIAPSWADDISNDLDGSIDAAAETMTLTVGGSDGTTNLAISPANSDGKSGCNLNQNNGQTLTVAVTSSDPLVALVTPATITLTSCGATPTLTVTPLLPGSTSISLSTVLNTTGATFDLAPATFDVNVGPAPDVTAPVIDHTLTSAAPDGDNDWYTGDVSLTWSVIDAESQGSVQTTGCDNVDVTSDQAATDYTCSASSDGGAATPSTVTIKRDGTDPSVDLSNDGPAAGATYYFGLDTVPAAPTCDATDATSGVNGDGCVVTGWDDQIGDHTITGTATDNAGNVGTATRDYTVLECNGDTSAVGTSCAPKCNLELATIKGTSGGPILGTEGDDVIVGTSGDDVIDGMGGNDTICGLDGADTISGGDGADVILGGTGADTLNGGAGNDIVRGGADDDTLNGDADDDTMKGEGGNDTLNGGDGADNLFGLIGDDAINGDAGNDKLVGASGVDIINGGDGDDNLQGGVGNDTLNGDAGEDTITGAQGLDSISGGDGDDTVYGGDHADTVHGNAGDDVLNGGGGNDEMYGDAGNDTLNGNDGDDSLSGDDDDDRLIGGAGDDTLAGGAGTNFARQ